MDEPQEVCEIVGVVVNFDRVRVGTGLNTQVGH